MNEPTRTGCVVKIRTSVLVLILVSCTRSSVVNGQEDKCDKLGSECVSIEKCDVLKELIQKPSKERDIVIKRTCGFDGDVPRVCCPLLEPNKCVTPEGTSGTCVGIEKCSHLLERSNAITKDDIDYVDRSRCEGPALHSVCCDFTIDVKPNRTNVNKERDLQERYIKKIPSENETLGLISVDEASNNNTVCGIEAIGGNKIAGGTKTAIDAWPWLALIEYERPYLCGGTLISSLYVLTAAHCLVTVTGTVTRTIKPRGVKSVRLGEYDITNDGKDCVEADGGGDDCTDGAVTITINTIIYHPDYLSVQNIKEANDIGLLRLSRSAPYTDFIRPICLPSSDDTKESIPSNRTFYVAGWGAVSNEKRWNDVKLEVDLPVLEQKTCQERYSMAGKSIIWDKQFCAGGDLNKDTCEGDSGGPLIYSDDGKIYQIVGVASFGLKQCGIQGRPSVYTKVIEYVPWILATIELQS